MASPAVSTPSTAGSPSAIALAPAPPALAIQTSNKVNMASIGAVPGVSTPTNMVTRKEWVIPPRPKPGRKPATDTPPTKRKAQNRAAQRAFRERRAARVGELEEQLDDTKEEHQRRETELRGKIVRLEADLERFNGELQSWRLRCDTLDRIADYERREKELAHAEIAYLRNGFQTTGTDAVPLPPRRPRQAQQQATSIQPYAQHVPSPAPDMEELGCGRCSSLVDCACADEALTLADSGCGSCSADTPCACLAGTLNSSSQVPMVTKRPHSPSTEIVKRQRQRQLESEPSTPLEIDFTDRFAVRPAQPAPIILQARPIESCGFCENGSYCMCADAAAAIAAANPGNDRKHENRLPPLLNEVTPPPSDNDVDSSNAKLPSMQPNQMHRPVTSQAPSTSCTNGPGTCQQCLADPKSGLFCRSLAKLSASSLSNSAPFEGCCGGNAAGGGCCKSVPAAAPSEPPPTLSCADAYKTLASHKEFEKASGELDNWIVSLHATPPDHAGRAPIEVEAASVMHVLKHFDRRFGRG